MSKYRASLASHKAFAQLQSGTPEQQHAARLWALMVRFTRTDHLAVPTIRKDEQLSKLGEKMLKAEDVQAKADAIYEVAERLNSQYGLAEAAMTKAFYPKRSAGFDVF